MMCFRTLISSTTPGHGLLCLERTVFCGNKSHEKEKKRYPVRVCVNICLNERLHPCMDKVNGSICSKTVPDARNVSSVLIPGYLS